MSSKFSIGDRMKKYYEEAYKTVLPMRMPVIIRLDGRAFHTLTKNLIKPFDLCFISIMQETAQYLCTNIHGAQLAYVQSDEISILLHNYKRLNSQAWFGNEVLKMTSVSAGMASAFFTYRFQIPAVFDSRIFVLPEDEVCNYFICRQQDWTRNSIIMLARSLYSHKECNKKNQNELQEMCFQKGNNWNDLETHLKRGTCIIKKDKYWIIDTEIPIFTKNRNYIEQWLEIEEK